MSQALSHQAADILSRLRREQIRCLYHWTYLVNFPVIRQVGALCSKQTLQDLGLWPPPKPGGEGVSWDQDRRHDNWDKFGLNFTPHTPMAHNRKVRGEHLCFFIVKTEVATWEGVWFTDTNAASNDHIQKVGLPGLDLVDFSAIQADPRIGDVYGWKRPVQAEVLVPDRIPLNYVERVVFMSEASLAEGERQWGSSEHPPFEVAPQYFTQGFRGKDYLPFVYIDRIILTDERITPENVDEPPEHCIRFRRAPYRPITALIRVHAPNETTVGVRVLPAEEETSMKARGDRTLIAQISKDVVSDGINSVEFELNTVRWCQIDFEMLGG
jgi:hypothetical protein